jgi:ABC-2 type transport system permease protein
MRTIGFILQKEFLQIFRNRAMLPIIFVMPVIQLLVLAFAATFEVRNSDVAVHDGDGSTTSMQLVQHIKASPYFNLATVRYAHEAADEDLLLRRARVIIRIPDGFERDLNRGNNAPVQLIVNAEDGAAAGVVLAYIQRILHAFSMEVVGQLHPESQIGSGHGIITKPAFWYNAELNYKHYMVPGILVVLVTMIGTVLSGMNIVREKEIGTIEQLNVTPIRKGEFIIGKLLPFWILALVELAVGLVVAWLIFRIPFRGNLLLIFGLAGLYLLVMLGFGLLVSTVTETQQQAMFIAWFFLVVFILMSGLFTPIESMPQWAQKLTLLNPLAHFIEIMRRVLLKGAGFHAVRIQFVYLAAFATLALTLAVRRYRKHTN